MYEGVYDPQNAHANTDGFRKDVLDALKPMPNIAMRYLCGNFASGIIGWMASALKKNVPDSGFGMAIMIAA